MSSIVTAAYPRALARSRQRRLPAIGRPLPACATPLILVNTSPRRCPLPPSAAGTPTRRRPPVPRKETLVRTPRSNGFRLAVACVVATTALAVPPAAAAEPVHPAGTPGAIHQVTLVTGDRVEYTEPVGTGSAGAVSPGARPRVVVDPAE